MADNDRDRLREFCRKLIELMKEHEARIEVDKDWGGAVVASISIVSASTEILQDVNGLEDLEIEDGINGR